MRESSLIKKLMILLSFIVILACIITFLVSTIYWLALTKASRSDVDLVYSEGVLTILTEGPDADPTIIAGLVFIVEDSQEPKLKDDNKLHSKKEIITLVQEKTNIAYIEESSFYDKKLDNTNQFQINLKNIDVSTNQSYYLLVFEAAYDYRKNDQKYFLDHKTLEITRFF